MSLVLLFLSATLATLMIGWQAITLIGGRPLPLPLRAGAAYGLGVVIVSQILAWSAQSQFALSHVSWGIVLVGLAIGISNILRHLSQNPTALDAPLSLRTRTAIGSRPFADLSVIVILLALLLSHVGWLLYNNYLRPDFPWDAFTTWLYRAKLWVIQDHIVPLAWVPDWVSAKSDLEYAIYANQYPKTVSTYAAFLGALTGGWQASIVGLSWTAAFLAICSITYGLLTLGGADRQQALISAYIVGSLPLLNIHAALAGYADLWTSLLSGGGLALLLLWSTRSERPPLNLALVMLLAGAQVKAEGWLWLLMGAAFVLIIWLVKRYGYRPVMLFALGLLTLLWLSDSASVHLGPLGQWGITDEALHAGLLGSYPLRPFNPISSYFSIVFQQFNFLFLGLAYGAALLALAITWRAKSLPFLIMGGMIAVSQYCIFGLSVYSQYAETGTAITRLLLHFLPVAVITVLIAWQAMGEKLDAKQRIDAPTTTAPTVQWSRSRISIGGITLAGTALLIPVGLFALKTNTNSNAVDIWLAASDLTPVVGEIRSVDGSMQFESSPFPVGVLSGPLWDKAVPQPRFLLTDTHFESTGAVSFYWIQSDSNGVQSTPIALSGESLIDLHRFDAWSEHRIKEYGYLIQSEAFGSTRVNALGLQSNLTASALPGLFRHWNQPEALSQKLINNFTGHVEAPLTLASFLNISFLVALGIGCLLVIIWPRPEILGSVGLALLVIWGVGDVMAIKNSALTAGVSNVTDHSLLSLDDASGQPFLALKGKIEDVVPETMPVVMVSMDERADFAAQKMPFLLLPRPAASLTAVHGRSGLADWTGALVLVGTDEAALDHFTDRLTLKSELPRQLRWQAEGVRIIAPSALTSD
ncbi:MAG: hypothetical protein O3C15_04580 [Proteobacteria bacterium]|nr:hypothetical protein [Pseudomonadota bacterium]